MSAFVQAACPMRYRLTLSRLEDACAATLGFELEELPTLEVALLSVLRTGPPVQRNLLDSGSGEDIVDCRARRNLLQAIRLFVDVHDLHDRVSSAGAHVVRAGNFVVVGKGYVVADWDDRAEDKEKARLVELKHIVCGQLEHRSAHDRGQLTACSRR